MARAAHMHLSRRERQIMDIVYAAGRATAAEVLEGMSEPPSYSTVRALLRVLEEKGHLRHEQEGPRYVFVPTVAKSEARDSALKHMLRTFFDGSAESAVAALLDLKASEMEPEELDRLRTLIAATRSDGG